MAGVFLYNIRDREKLNKIRFVLFKLGLSCREISPEDFAQPIGYLAGLPGFAPSDEAPEPFEGEMLVMHDLDSARFSALLNGLRQNRVPVALKAVVTEHNVQWSSSRLFRELSAEHEAMKRAGAKSVHQKKR